MALSITTEEATEIKSNSMKLNANVNDLDIYDLALCYFNYGHKSDLSDAQKSTGCALVDQPGHIEFLQEFIDDNQDYYYEANIQNYEGTKTQELYLKNNKFLNIDFLNNNYNAEIIANNSGTLENLLSDKNMMYQYFSSQYNSSIANNVSETIEEAIVCKGLSEENKMTLKSKVDLTDYSTIYFDFSNSGSGKDANFHNYSRIYIDNNQVYIRKGVFSRFTQAIDVSNINKEVEIAVSAYYEYDVAYSIFNLYGIWLEK
jgi:hypothetical protein